MPVMVACGHNNKKENRMEMHERLETIFQCKLTSLSHELRFREETDLRNISRDNFAIYVWKEAIKQMELVIENIERKNQQQ